MIRAVSLLPLMGAILSLTLIVVAVAGRRHRSKATIRYFVLLNIGTALWSAGHFIELNAGLAESVFVAEIGTFGYWLNIMQALGAAAAPTYWFLLAAASGGRMRWLRPPGLIVAHLPLAYSLIVTPTNPLHMLEMRLADGQIALGPLGYPDLIGSWVLIVAGIVVFIASALRRGTTDGRREAVFVAVASLAPFAGGMVSNSRMLWGEMAEVNLIPVAFPLMSAVLGYLVLRVGFADIIPFAASEAFQTMSDAAFVVDDHSILLACNTAAEESFPGAHPGGRLGDAAPVVARALDGCRGGDCGVVELPHDGRVHLMRVRPMRPLWRRSVGTLVLLTDVTELKTREAELGEARDRMEERVRERTRELERANVELEEATRAKDRFMANVSHELRTPLTSIISFTDGMLRGSAGPLSEDQAERLRIVNTAGRHQRAIVEDLLDLSRIKIGTLDVDARPFMLSGFLTGLAGMLRPMVEESGLRFGLETPEQDLEMETDEAKLRQILLNLATNAVKFTEEGTVTVIADHPSADRVSFSVRDTGAGIPARDLPTIMDEFVQVQRVDGTSPTGTGLGLAISRRLAVMLGGELTVTSAPGEGSTFTLTLPLRYAEGYLS